MAYQLEIEAIVVIRKSALKLQEKDDSGLLFWQFGLKVEPNL